MNPIELRAYQFANEVRGHVAATRYCEYVEVSPERFDGLPILLVASWLTYDGRANFRLDNSRIGTKHPADLLDSEVTLGRRGQRVWVRALDASKIQSITMTTNWGDGVHEYRVVRNPLDLVDAAEVDTEEGSWLRSCPIPSVAALGTRATQLVNLAKLLDEYDLYSPMHEARRANALSKLGATALVDLWQWIGERVERFRPSKTQHVTGALGIERELDEMVRMLDKITDYVTRRLPVVGLGTEEIASIAAFVNGMKAICECLHSTPSDEWGQGSYVEPYWNGSDSSREMARDIAALIYMNPDLGRDPDDILRFHARKLENKWQEATVGWLLLRWATQTTRLHDMWSSIDAALRCIDASDVGALEPLFQNANIGLVGSETPDNVASFQSAP